MAKDSFKVKKSLNIKPTDPATLSNSEVGDIVIDSTDNNKLKTYNDSSSSFVSVSSVGSLDTLLAEDFETTLAADFISGNAASPDTVPTGSFGGTLADETSNQLSGVRSLKYTMNATSASSDNDFFLNDTDIALAVKQRGNFIGINFYYTYNGDDDDIRFFVLDQDDNELTQSDEYIKSASTATRFSTSVFVPSSDTAIRYGFQVVTGNSSKVFIVDDIEFSTNPFVYKNLAEENVYSARIANNGTATVTSQNQSWVDSVSRTAAGLVVVNYSSLGLTETPSLQVIPEISNIAQFTAHVDAISTTSATIRIGFDNGTDLDTDFSITLQKQGADYQAPAEHVVTPAKAVVESARFDTHAGYGSTNTLTPYFSNERENTISQLGTIINDSTNGFRFTASETVYVSIQYTTRTDSNGNDYWGISRNPSGATTDITSLAAGERLSVGGRDVNDNRPHSVSAFTKLDAGDFIDLRHSGSWTPASLGQAIVQITVQKAEAQFLAAVPVPLVAILKDVKSSGTAGGQFTSGSWQTRTLNTVEGDSEIVSLSSNQFTLQRGKYIIEGNAPAHMVNRHKTRIYDVTNSAEAIIGTSSYAVDTYVGSSSSDFSGVIEISSPTTYRLEHRAQTTKTTNGFGRESNFGNDEVFATVKITKLK